MFFLLRNNSQIIPCFCSWRQLRSTRLYGFGHMNKNGWTFLAKGAHKLKCLIKVNIVRMYLGNTDNSFWTNVLNTLCRIPTKTNLNHYKWTLIIKAYLLQSKISKYERQSSLVLFYVLKNWLKITLICSLHF